MTTPDPFASVTALGITAPSAQSRLVSRRPGMLPVPLAIQQWRAESTAWLAVDDADSARNLRARRQSTELPRVVVVGETGRGKSSLVNALLGIPGLSPVDADIATCTYLVFVHSENPYAIARFGGGPADIAFPVKDLRSWATVAGEPDVDIPSPRWIEVGVPAAVTATLVLVDTPGVGGLVAAHGELAAEAAAAAAALVFLVDASAPLTRGELDFLAAVTDRVESVYFVMTKTDAYRGWREVIEANRILLGRYAPRFRDAMFHPVSSRLAQASTAQSDPRIAEVLREQSGIGGLRDLLMREVSASAEMISDLNIIRTGITVLSGAVVGLTNRRMVLTAGAAQAEVLRARRDQLVGRRRAGTRGWQVMLRAEIQRARVDLTHETGREVREAAQMFRGSIDQADSAELKNMAFHVDAYAQAMTARAHSRLIDAMGRICQAVLSELLRGPEMTVLVSQLATRPYTGLTTRVPDRSRNMDDTIMTMSGAGMGFTLSRMMTMVPAAALPAAFGVVMAPVSIVLGGAAAFYLMRSRRRMADKIHLKQWLMEVLGEAKAQIDQNIAEQFIEADEQLTLALDDVLNRQVASLDTAIEEVGRALELDASERTGRLRLLEDRRAAGSSLLTGGEALLRRIRTAMAGAVRAVETSAATAGLARAASGLPSAGASGQPATAHRSIRLPSGLRQLAAEQQGVARPSRGRHAVEPDELPRPDPVRPSSVYAGLNLSALLAAAVTQRIEPRSRPGVDDAGDEANGS